VYPEVKAFILTHQQSAAAAYAAAHSAQPEAAAAPVKSAEVAKSGASKATAKK